MLSHEEMDSLHVIAAGMLSYPPVISIFNILFKGAIEPKPESGPFAVPTPESAVHSVPLSSKNQLIIYSSVTPCAVFIHVPICHAWLGIVHLSVLQ